MINFPPAKVLYGTRIDNLTVELGIDIRCITRNVPDGLQWLFGWVIKYDDTISYTSGGATKAEIINHVVAKRATKINAFDKIKTTVYY